MFDDPAVSTSRRADLGAVVFTMGLPTLVTWLYFVLLARHPTAVQQTAYGIGKTIQFAFPLVWVLAIQRRRLPWKPPRTAGLLESIGFGLLVLLAMFLLYHAWLKPAGYLDATSEAGRAIRDKLTGFGVNSFPKYFALGAFYSLFHSLLEEYYWRWFVFGQLRRLVSVPTAIALSSLAFMAHHVILLSMYFGWFSPAAILFSLAVAVGGAVWAWIYHRSDSLYGPWLSHLLVDAAIFIVGYDLVRSLMVS